MCTAVVGGSIHRAATRITTASDQRSASPMRNRRSKNRTEPFLGGVLGCTSGFSLTFQNNRLGWIVVWAGIDTVPDKSCRTLQGLMPWHNSFALAVQNEMRPN